MLAERQRERGEGDDVRWRRRRAGRRRDTRRGRDGEKEEKGKGVGLYSGGGEGEGKGPGNPEGKPSTNRPRPSSSRWPTLGNLPGRPNQVLSPLSSLGLWISAEQAPIPSPALPSPRVSSFRHMCHANSNELLPRRNPPDSHLTILSSPFLSSLYSESPLSTSHPLAINNRLLFSPFRHSLPSSPSPSHIHRPLNLLSAYHPHHLPGLPTARPSSISGISLAPFRLLSCALAPASQATASCPTK